MYGYNTNSNYSRAGDGVLGLLLTATATAGTPASTGRAHGPQEGEEGAGVHGCVEAKIIMRAGEYNVEVVEIESR